MARTLKILLVSELLFLSPIVSSQNPIACVDTDIANTLLGSPGERGVKISRQLPRQFPRIDFPEALELIGSRTAPHFSMVAFKSPLSIEETRTTVESTMADAKWKAYKMPHLGSAGGFQSSIVDPIRAAASFCHNDFGHMSVAFSQAPKQATYVTLMGSMQRSFNACDMTGDRLMMSHFSGTAGKMPRLSLPENATSENFGGLSSSGDGASTSTQLETTLSSAELLAFFGAQLTAQEWREETRWSGRKISGSVWIAADEKASGVLRIALLGDNQYKLGFQMTLHQFPGGMTSRDVPVNLLAPAHVATDSEAK